MTLLTFIRLVRKNIRLLLLTAFVAAFAAYMLTKDAKKIYSSKTVINTGVVSGYTILNHNSDSRIDREYTRSELQNLLALASAYETTEDLAFRLLAHYLTELSLVPNWITSEGKLEIDLIFTDDFLKEIDTRSYDAAYLSIKNIAKQEGSSLVKDLLYSKHSFFGVEQLQTIRKTLKHSSDLLEFSYKTEDPAVCQQTLVLITQIFLEKHRSLKESQSVNVLDYFEKATRESAEKLRQAENKLLNFRINNNIINYYEQTRFIADKKEDLDEFLFKEKMTLNAAKAAKEKLDKQLSNRGLLADLNNKLLAKRDELSEVTKNLAMLEFLSMDQEVNDSKLEMLKVKKDMILSDMSGLTSTSQKINFTQEGVDLRNLLSKWLDTVIQLEESTSRLKVIEERKVEFTEIYKRFAPWGSQLKKIEREIGLAEEAYLENLHSFNQARLHLQNTLMSTNLKILEAPFFPAQAENSKAVILIAMAFICGLLIPLSFFIVLEYLDQTMKNPIESCGKLGLPLLGAFPKINTQNNWSMNRARIDYLALRNQSVNLIARKLKAQIPEDANASKPHVIAISSMRGKEGASYMARYLSRDLAYSSNVLHLAFDQNSIKVYINGNKTELIADINTDTEKDLIELINNKLADKVDYKLIVIELPAVLHSEWPRQILSKLDDVLLVCKANRVWATADKLAWEMVEEHLGKMPQLIVNGVDPNIMEQFVGEVPKNRSFIRKKIKQYISFNFSNTEVFS